MKKIRILFAIPNFITAGSGREMFNIIEGLDKNTFEVLIAVQQSGGGIYEEAMQKGYKIITHSFIAPETNIISKLLFAKKNASFFKTLNIDIWQSFNWSSDFSEVLVARWSGTKYIYVKKNMNWGRKAWTVKSYLANAIIARNKTLIRTIFSNNLYKHKTVYITGGVDTEHFSQSRTGIHKQYNLPPNRKIVTCTAQIVRIKDQATLVKAIAKVNDVHLILAGSLRDEPYVKELRQLIEALKLTDRVSLAGSVGEVVSLLNGGDIFVLPTSKLKGHEEGCPVALLEAMACGLPAIASNVAGSNDLIENNKTGLLFEERDAEQLANCINRYLTDEAFAKEMAQNALNKVKADHTLQKETEAFTKLYLKLTQK